MASNSVAILLTEFTLLIPSSKLCLEQMCINGLARLVQMLTCCWTILLALLVCFRLRVWPSKCVMILLAPVATLMIPLSGAFSLVKTALSLFIRVIACGHLLRTKFLVVLDLVSWSVITEPAILLGMHLLVLTHCPVLSFNGALLVRPVWKTLLAETRGIRSPLVIPTVRAFPFVLGGFTRITCTTVRISCSPAVVAAF